MPTECSAVSDLIQRVHGRRLRTDPSDELLFNNGQRPPVPLLMEPPRTPIPAENRHAYPAAPRERRTWPFVVAAVLAGAIGIAGVAYGKRVFDRDDTASVAAAAPETIGLVAPVVPPPVASPTPASKTWSTADQTGSTAEATPPSPTAAPSTTPPTADPTLLADQPVPAAEPTQQTARKSPSPRAKSKRVAKRAVKNRRLASTPATESARNPPARRVESPTPPTRAAKQRQSADDENPL